MPEKNLAKLPYELMEMILLLILPDSGSELSTQTLTSLCLTSRLFKRIVQPQLYKTVWIYSAHSSIRFFSTLETNPRLWNHLEALYHEPVVTRKSFEAFDFPISRLRAPQLKELVWISGASMGGFLIGHHLSTSSLNRQGKPATEVEADSNYSSYHIITPTLEDWIHKRIASMDHLTDLTVTIFPGMVLDDDKIEHVLRKTINCSYLQSIAVEIGHSAVDFGSRLRRIHKSKSVSRAVDRISSRTNRSGHDVDISVKTCQHGFRVGSLEEDMKSLLRKGWEHRLRATV